MSQKRLQIIIEEKREQLIQIGTTYGLNSSIAIHYSKELDKLLNEYHQRYIAKKFHK